MFCRFATFYERDGSNHRDLFKAYGIRFIIKVSGYAGKFNIVPLLMNVGSGIGLLALVSDQTALGCLVPDW